MDRPVIVGEVLFDCFEDGKRLGGAPFNVAWHLRGFGLEPLLVSRVGADALGDEVLASMRRWGMEVSGVQRDDGHPTGTVQVAIRDGQPQFEILADQAYDHIDWNAVEQLVRHAGTDLLYHGTLALRQDTAADGMRRLRERSGARVLVDANLRPPWWSRDGVRALLGGVDCLKLSDSELTELGSGSDAATARAASLRRELGLGTVVVTVGEAGAFAVHDGGIERVPAAPVPRLVDSVGAGDAFSSVVVLGLLRSWPWRDTLRRAAEFAALACGHRGAVREDSRPYHRLLQRWQSDG